MTENNSFGDTLQEKIEECEAVIRHAVKGKFPHEQALDELVGYATPQQRDSSATPRTWVGLTRLEQKVFMAMSTRDAVFLTEAKLKEKNT